MKVKDILDVCEQLEHMAKKGRDLVEDLPSEGEVPVRHDEDRALFFIFEWMWALRLGARNKP